jgi:FkbM family methyltransferase
MLIPVSDLVRFWNVLPKGILHVGAHLAEEKDSYEENNWTENGTIWVEAQPLLAINLKATLDPKKNRVIEAVVWSEDDKDFKLNMASNSASTSLLEFGTHSTTYPSISMVDSIDVKTARLDSLLTHEDLFDFVNIDIQGAELQALIGMGDLLDQCKWVYLEVNKIQVYKDCAIVGDIDKYLETQGFRRVHTLWIRGAGWGDALYARRTIYSQTVGQKIRVNMKYRVIPAAKFPLRVLRKIARMLLISARTETQIKV